MGWFEKTLKAVEGFIAREHKGLIAGFVIGCLLMRAIA